MIHFRSIAIPKHIGPNMKSSVVIAALESFGASTTALCFVDMPPSLLNSTPPRHFAAPSAARGRVGVRRFLSAQTPGDMGVMCQLVSSRRSGLGKGCTEGGLGRDSFSWARARLPGDTTAGGGDGARRRSTRLASGGRGNFNSVPGYKRGPPDDDEDIWSRGSVFEFRRCACFCSRKKARMTPLTWSVGIMAIPVHIIW